MTAIALARPDLTVVGGYLDVQQPDMAGTLDALPADASAVVVPLLLSAGYHLHVDLQEETGAVDGPTTVSAALGPDERLIDVLVERLVQVGYRSADELISSLPVPVTLAPSKSAAAWAWCSSGCLAAR